MLLYTVVILFFLAEEQFVKRQKTELIGPLVMTHIWIRNRQNGMSVGYGGEPVQYMNVKTFLLEFCEIY